MNHLTRDAIIMLGLVWGVILANMLYGFSRLLTTTPQLGGDDHE
jgi:hypothetical protein